MTHAGSIENPVRAALVNRYSGVVLGANQQAGTGEHSATEVSQNVSQDPDTGSDGLGAAAANRDNLNSYETTDPGCADPEHSLKRALPSRMW